MLVGLHVLPGPIHEPSRLLWWHLHAPGRRGGEDHEFEEELGWLDDLEQQV